MGIPPHRARAAKSRLKAFHTEDRPSLLALARAPPQSHTRCSCTVGADESALAYIKVFECRKFVINNIRGYLPGRIVQFLTSLHMQARIVF